MGNSTTNVGLFDLSGGLIFRGKLPTMSNTTPDDCALKLKGLFDLYGADIIQVTGGILSSVVPSVTQDMIQGMTLITGRTPLVMGAGIKTGLNIKSDVHTQMGSDIVAGAVAGMTDYPPSVIVVDMGTATTMSYLKSNVYEGCAILTGVCLALDALAEGAAALSHISLKPPSSVLGHNTEEALRAGAIFGHASMIDGMIDRMEAEGGTVGTVVVTGEYAPLVMIHCTHAMHHDPDLLLRGLFLIYGKKSKISTKI